MQHYYKMISEGLQKKVVVYLFSSFADIQRFLNERQKLGIKLGLERIKSLLSYSGNPERQTIYIHVAGTNGKGSTIAYLRTALHQNGYNVGVFSSPSLRGIRGHIMINDQYISEQEMLNCFKQLYPAIEDLDNRNQHPTNFEILTAIAFIYFAKYTDIALIETGMGGRGDTTNVINPLLSIITTVQYDHMQFLGDTITDIAHEKAGILKAKTPIIIGDIPEEGKNIIRHEAKKLQAPLYEFNQDFTAQNRLINEANQSFHWTYQALKQKITISQAGSHQIHNCSLAMMAIVLLKERGFTISLAKTIHSFQQVLIPGRFEKVFDKPPVYIDGAHNISSMKTLIELIQEKFHRNDQTIVFGAFRDKDIQGMVNLLKDAFPALILTSFDHPRAATVAELQTYVNAEDDHIKIINEKEFDQLIHAIKEKLNNNQYIFTGSLFFITKVRHFFEFK